MFLGVMNLPPQPGETPSRPEVWPGAPINPGQSLADLWSKDLVVASDPGLGAPGKVFHVTEGHPRLEEPWCQRLGSQRDFISLVAIQSLTMVPAGSPLTSPHINCTGEDN